MTVIFQSTVRITNLSIQGVESYLRTTGWTKVATPTNPNALVYAGPLDIHGEPIIVVLPAHEDLTDANRRMNEVVRTVAKIEGKSPRHVAMEIVGRGLRSVNRIRKSARV